ncbi:hypothetical protein GCM10009755_28960 [Brevibacterium samyangense]|uniref:C2H2-type domain-containing protein n=1 Tax=Brevibacterium samyangense TaxID=366888 RepID=A0ABP5F2X3_9MICO
MGRPILRDAPDRTPSTAATDALLHEIRARAATLGLALTTRCKHCGAALTETTSLKSHAGPVCRKRQQEAPGAHPAKNDTEGQSTTTSTFTKEKR